METTRQKIKGQYRKEDGTIIDYDMVEIEEMEDIFDYSTTQYFFYYKNGKLVGSRMYNSRWGGWL